MNSAIIGLGVIGKVHYDTLKKQGENVVAICDIDSGKLANFSADRKYDDYKKMLDDGGINVVHVCTPHYLHAEKIKRYARRVLPKQIQRFERFCKGISQR